MAIRGRGVEENPPNRFESQKRSREGIESDPKEGETSPKTEFIPDSTKSIIAYNDSPDVGFDAGINPYRGCEHGCAYCLSGETPILMVDGSARRLGDLKVGDAIYGTVKRDHYRYFVKTRVLAYWQTFKRGYCIRLADGTVLVASGDHRFLTERGWKYVTGDDLGPGQRPHLTVNNSLMGFGAVTTAPVSAESEDYRRGYLCGVVRGDGHLAFYPYQREGRSHGNQYRFRLAMTDLEALGRTRSYLQDFGVLTNGFLFQEAAGSRKALHAIRTHARASVERIEGIATWPPFPGTDWCKGFLAGLFDAEGSYSQGVLRITNTDEAILEHGLRSLRGLGFDCVIELHESMWERPLRVIRVRGGLREHLRFFQTVRPAIHRKRDITGFAVKSRAGLRVVSIKPMGELPLFDITTGTGDFIADGVISHNCYARPTHEYLGYSAGLDFETKIVVKERAPELLRAEMSKSNWKPQVLALSGVTDPYQPVERRLRLTRRCLEVLVEFRNPVVVITKNALVCRDRDLLSELARHNAAAVCLSVTTLDPALCGVLEPRTSRPAKRLEAISLLIEAGIPAGVLVAPVIPGLTDSEIPAIIAAAAQRGARFAQVVPLRLPYAVAPIFEQWLSEHMPERKAKVLNRIRAIRGGRLNDPNFGSRMQGEGIFAAQIRALFNLACRKSGISPEGPELSTEHFVRPGKQQSLF